MLKISTNPFGKKKDDEEEEKKTGLKISENPFSSLTPSSQSTPAQTYSPVAKSGSNDSTSGSALNLLKNMLSVAVNPGSALVKGLTNLAEKTGYTPAERTPDYYQKKIDEANQSKREQRRTLNQLGRNGMTGLPSDYDDHDYDSDIEYYTGKMKEAQEKNRIINYRPKAEDFLNDDGALRADDYAGRSTNDILTDLARLKQEREEAKDEDPNALFSEGNYDLTGRSSVPYDEREEALNKELYTARQHDAELADYEQFQRYEKAMSVINDPDYSVPDELKSVLESGERPKLYGLDNDAAQYMTDDELGAYSYVYRTQGAEAAAKFFDEIAPYARAENRRVVEDKATQFASAHPTAASVLDVLRGFAKPVEYARQAIDIIPDGELTQNASYNKTTWKSNATQQKVSEIVEDNYGKAGSFAYGVGMSMANFISQNVVAGALTGGAAPAANALALGIMGSGAAADTVVSAMDRGLSDKQAFELGTIAGAAEVVTEKVSLDTLFDAKLWKDSTIKYILKNTIAEGSEEVGSDLINLAADAIVSKDRSEWNTELQQMLIENPKMTRNKAWGKLLGKQMMEIGSDFLAGAISGGIMSGGQSVRFNYSQDADTANARGFRDTMLALEDVARGKEVSDRDVRAIAGNEAGTEAINELLGTDLGTVREDRQASVREALQGVSDRANVAALESSIDTGERLKNSQIARIAKNSAAIEALNRNYGTDIQPGQADTARQVRDTIRGAETAQDKYRADVEQYAKNNFGKAGQTVMTRSYNGTQTSDQFIADMTPAYNMGRDGVQYSSPRELMRENSTITEAQAQAAYIAGQADAKNQASETSDRQPFNAQNQQNAPTVTPSRVAAATPARQSAPMTIRDKFNADVAQYARENFGRAGQTVMEQSYDGEQRSDQYIAEMTRPYNMGREGIAYKNVTELMSEAPTITVAQAQAAYIAGQADAERMSYGQAEAAVPVYEGAERNDGAYPAGQVETVPGGTNERVSAKSRDREAAGVITSEYEVDLEAEGFPKGHSGKIYKVVGNYSQANLESFAYAAKHGVKLNLFVGDYLSYDNDADDVHIENSIRGVKLADGSVWVKADDSEQMSLAITKHEVTHVRVARGEIDMKAVKQRTHDILRAVGRPNDYEWLAENYARVFNGSGYTADDILEEIICDAEADINVFESALTVNNERVHETMEVVRQAKKAGANQIRGPTEELSKSGIDVDTKDGSAYANDLIGTAYSQKTLNASEWALNQKIMVDGLAETLGVGKAKAKRYVNDIFSVAKLISNNAAKLDYDAAPGLSPFVSNTEYGGSIDFDTLCTKRRLFTGTFSAIQNRLSNEALTAEDYLKIRQMMVDAGLETFCGKCYVEGSRAAMGKFCAEFRRLYKQYYPNEWQPMQKDLTTPDGVEAMRLSHPKCYEQYERFFNNHGTLTKNDKSIFASQQKPKLYQAHSAYTDEILREFKGKEDSIISKNRNGGVRFQSFSDCEVIHIIDGMQAIMDMSYLGLNGQAYTKQENFALAFGNTGLKINLSIDAWGVDADGNLIFNDVEGMPFKTAMDLRDKFSENVGTICVVYDDAMLKAALADDRIDFIIPFHRSQWKKSQYGAMGLPNTTKDYTYQQNEKWLNPKSHTHQYRDRIVPTRCTNYMPNDYWDFSKSGKENAEAYLEMCARDGKRPKFYRFLVNNGDGSFSLQPDGSTDGYWKLLIDFKMYDNNGKGSPQMPVRPAFGTKEDGIKTIETIFNEYKGSGHESYPVAHGIVDQFVDEYNKKNGTKYSRNTEMFNRASVEAALWESFDHNDMGDDNLIRVSSMPKYISEKIGINGDIYLYRDHAYENMVSKDQAEADGRPIKRGGKNIDFHNLGIEKMTDAIVSINNPTMVIAGKGKDGNPVVTMILSEFGNNGAPLYATLGFYSNKPINGQFTTRPHIVLSIAERPYFNTDGRDGYADVIGRAVEKGKVIDFNYNKRDDLSVIANQARVGNITASSLERNLSQFKKEVNDFKKLNKINYSLSLVNRVNPSTSAWSPSLTTDEVMEVYPDLWNVAADDSESRNPTQITSTVKTYRKIYDILKEEDFNGSILDASSGLGYGTRAGIDEYGFDVEDIEPFPDKGYSPKYTDYSKLNKKYDAIISNAVLNVLPREQRDALVVKMGQMLKPGGRMFINVRSLSEIQNLQKAVDKKTGKLKNIKLSESEAAETTHGSYQKGFTKDELKAYLEDALGEGYTVEKTNAFGGTSVIVTKNSSVKYSRSLDSEYLELAKDPEANRDKLQKMVDEAAKEAGYTEKWYHGTGDASWTVFDMSASTMGKKIFLSDIATASEYAGTKAKPFPTSLIGKEIKTVEDAVMFISTVGPSVMKDGNDYILLKFGTKSKPFSEERIIAEANRIRNVIKGGVYALYVNPGTGKVHLDANGQWWDNITVQGYGRRSSTDNIAIRARANGATSVQIDNVVDGNFGFATSDDMIVFSADQIKSADPVTYDDSGNVIPLSQRFNTKSPDIRYSQAANKEYLELAKDPKKNEKRLRELVDDAMSVKIGVTSTQREDGYDYDDLDIAINGSVVGTAQVMYNDEGAYVERIDIDEGYQNQGIGTEALRLINEKYGDFLIAPDNENAKRLYDRLGYETTESDSEYIDQGYGVYKITYIRDKAYHASKYADIVTYDDSGNVIPLSQRFNTKSPDIRYSQHVLMGSLFSGAGTLEAGLTYQMLDKEFAVEYNKQIASVYTDNHGKEHMFVGDVRDFDSKSKRNVFYLHASPVCKNYSAASHGGGENDVDITTAEATARVLEEQRPTVFTVENVERYIDSEAYGIITNKLDELGYSWDVDVYKASDYGNATKRKRMFIRAVAPNISLPGKPAKSHGITSWGEATRDLWETDLIPSYLVESQKIAIGNTKELAGLDLTSLEQPLMIYDTTKSKKATYAWADGLAPTLTTKCGAARIIMPDGKVYKPTPKFMGRIQGLPDNYKYPEANTVAFRVIGNGIPTQLTNAVSGGLLDSAYEQTHNGEVLYSQRVTSLADLEKANTELRDQYNELKADAKHAKERWAYWKGQTKLSNGASAVDADIHKTAKKLLKDFSSTMELDDAKKDLREIAKMFLENKDIDTVKKAATKLAEKVVLGAQELISQDQEAYEYIKTSLRKGVKLSAADKAEIPDYNDWRKEHFGTVNVSSNGVPVEDLYAEIQGKYGYLSGDAMNTADMLDEIISAYESVSPVYENPFDMDRAETVEYCADGIVSSLMDGEIRQTKPTFADKKQAELNAYKKKAQKKITELKQKRERDIAALKERHREYVKGEREKKLRRELRGKIERHVKSLADTLTKPTDKRHIMDAFQAPVAELLSAINTESAFDNEVNQFGQVVGRAKKGEGYATKRTEAFRKLQDVLKNYKQDLVIDPDLFGTEEASGLFSYVTTELNGVPLYEMNSEQLTSVWKTVSAMEAAITSANKMFAKSRWANIDQAAEGFLSDNAGKKSKTLYEGYLGILQNAAGLYSYTPQTYLHMLGKSGDSLFRLMRGAQDKQINLIKEASEKVGEMLKGVNVRELETELHAVDIGTEKRKMSTAQIMELYCLMQRPQARAHLENGGVYIEERKTKGVKRLVETSAVVGTWEQYEAITDLLSKQQKEACDKMVRFLSDDIAAWGNEASLAVYGYSKFGEKFYWPIRVFNNALHHEQGKQVNEAKTVSHKGMTFLPTPGASNSINIGSVFDTFTDHIVTMSVYNAWLGASEDINRLRNYKYDNGKNMADIIDLVHGRSGVRYLDKLMEDIAVGRTDSNEFLNISFGKFKGAAVGANLRVIIQQPTAILRSMDMLRASDVLAGGSTAWALNGWKKAVKHAPIAQWKDWGYFDIRTGRQLKDIILDSDTKIDKFNNFMMKGAALADSIGWGWLWNACELDVKRSNQSLWENRKNDDAFYKKVAERFAEVVDKTQVVDGVLQRSQIMRDGDSLSKMMTSFMGEPTKQFNMFAQSAYDAKQKLPGAGKRLARTGMAFLASGILNVLAQSIVDGWRDDDKDKPYLQRVLEQATGVDGGKLTAKSALTSNLGSMLNPMNYVIVLKDIMSIIEGYDTERTDMSLIADLWTSGTKLWKATVDGSGKNSVLSATTNFAATFAKFYGIPIANINRDAWAIANEIAQASGNYEIRYEMLKLARKQEGNKSLFLDLLYTAYKNDPKMYERIREDLIKEDLLKTSNSTTEDYINDAIRDREWESVGIDEFNDLSEDLMRTERYSEMSGNAQDKAVEVLREIVKGTSSEKQKDVSYLIGDVEGAAFFGDLEDAKSWNPDKSSTNLDQSEISHVVEDYYGDYDDRTKAILWSIAGGGKSKNNPWYDALPKEYR